MTIDLNLIPDTIIIANPALVVDESANVPDLAKMLAKELTNKTSRPLTYGDFEDPAKAGQPVYVLQGKYVVLLAAVVDEPLTVQECLLLGQAVEGISSKVEAVGTLRQDFIPVVSPNLAAKLGGEIWLEYEERPESEE